MMYITTVALSSQPMLGTKKKCRLKECLGFTYTPTNVKKCKGNDSQNHFGI
jgi:hypothetical protein